MDTQPHAHLKQLLVDRLPDCALVVLDTDGKVLSWNAGAEGLLGYLATEAVGQPFSRIVPPETLGPAGAPASLEIAREGMAGTRRSASGCTATAPSSHCAKS